MSNMKKYLNMEINLDKRDKKGIPTITCTPKGGLLFLRSDPVVLSISLVENGKAMVILEKPVTYHECQYPEGCDTPCTLSAAHTRSMIRHGEVKAT